MMQGQYYSVIDENARGLALREVAEFDLPFKVQCKRVKNEKRLQLERKVHAMIDDVARHKQAPSIEVKKDLKVELGRFEVRHNHLTGGKSYNITSFSKYSDDELKDFISELDVWCAEQRIPLSDPRGMHG